MPILLRPLDSTDESPPFTPTASTPSASVPAEKTLDPGETIVSSDAVDVIAQIISLNDSLNVSKAEIDPSTASLIIYAILIYFVIKIAFRLLPWILGIGAIILFAKMGGGA
jgi:hypothetical protein